MLVILYYINYPNSILFLLNMEFKDNYSKGGDNHDKIISFTKNRDKCS